MQPKKLGLSLSLLAAAVVSGFASEPEGLMSPAAVSAPTATVLTESPDFDRASLLAPDYRQPSVAGFSFLNPNRFSMQQSYSVSFASGSFGSQSAGLYLNTLSYKLANPLTLSADIGFYTPLYTSAGGIGSGLGRGTFQNPGASSLVLPRLGLEYKPSEHSSISLQLINGPDAWKAYGNPFSNPWSR